MPKSEIVPFGKYKGQPVEVLQRDKEYCDWLMEQDWFRTSPRFQPIYTIIVNHFGEPAETPEHNQLQACLTDDEFAKRLVWHLHRDKIAKDFPGARESALAWIGAELREVISKTYPGESIQDLPEKRREGVEAARSRQKRLEGELEKLRQLSVPGMADLQVTAAFESHGIDVVLAYGLIPDGEHTQYWIGLSSIHIECKPSLGDDYPAVLRQIVASHDFGEHNVTNVLLIGSGGYTGTGASFQQVKAIFESRKVRIVFLKDIPASE